MTPLTLENAKTLKAGEMYRVGVHDHNLWELDFMFAYVRQSQEDFGQARVYEHLLETGALKQEPDQYPLTKHIENLRKLWIFGWHIKSADEFDIGQWPSLIAYECHEDMGTQIYEGCDDSYFGSGSGAEPLWILEDGETCEDIPRARIKSIEEMKQCK